MPTVLRVGPFRLFFYSSDGSEPAHIHVEQDDNVAKFLVDPVRLQSSGGFTGVELNRIERVVIANRNRLIEEWNDFFDG